MQPRYDPRGVEERWQRTWEQEGQYNAGADAVAARRSSIAHAAAERDRRAAHGSRAPARARRHARPLAAHAGLQHALGSRATTTLASRRRTRSRGSCAGGNVAPGARPRGVRRARVGRGSRSTAATSWASSGAGRLARLLARALHDGRRATSGRSMRFFVHLYEKGWIYRANRIVNWCPYHRPRSRTWRSTTPSVDDTLTTCAIRSPTATGSDRDRDGPAGDDPRRTSPWRSIRTTSATATLIGKEVIVPVVERRVPVIADERVEPEFGTGALKITPGHDPVDFEIGRDHGLPELTVHRPRRAHERKAGGLDGLSQERGRRARRRLAARARPAREARAVPARGRATASAARPDRAADLAAVVLPWRS